jgi:glycine/D-amino acid oxidase-like deaminating enzyme
MKSLIQCGFTTPVNFHEERNSMSITNPPPATRHGPLEGAEIVVVGSGVLGLLTALSVWDLGAEVTIIADEQLTTISRWVNGGLIEPYASKDERTATFAGETLPVYRKLGIKQRFVQERWGILYGPTVEQVQPDWSDQVISFVPNAVSPMPEMFPYASYYRTVTIRPDMFVDHLLQRCAKRDIPIVRERITSLDEVVAKHQPHAMVVAAGIGMQSLWPNAEISCGMGLVYVVNAPWYESYNSFDHLAGLPTGDPREIIYMNTAMPAYSIPRLGSQGHTQLVIGGTNLTTESPTDLPQEEALAHYEENVAIGLPPAFTKIVNSARRNNLGSWRYGARPMRTQILLDTINVDGIPAIGLGGAGGSGMSIWAGLIRRGIDLLAEQLRADKNEITIDWTEIITKD